MYTKWGSPSGLGELGRRAIYFWEAGRNAKYLRGARKLGSKHLILGSWGAVSKYKYFQGAGEIVSLFSRSKDSPWEGPLKIGQKMHIKN